MMAWHRSKQAPRRRAVAYYRHSAQDRQENSVEIQQDQVRAFAAEHGIEIIKEFADRGKSGLSVEGRDSFNEMIHEYVEAGKDDFEYVLVLDVSRWGRFQETDMSAYYTGLCLQHGKQVVFTTIGFPKENDLLHGLHLSIERYRAASYSRELSGKVWKGCAKIASSGYWAGGSAPYAMCRLLLDEKRQPVQVLARGEHKAIHNQRVTLAPGDSAEVNTVREVFSAFVQENQSPRAIAAQLNSVGRPAPGGGSWSAGAVGALLRNEVYAGTMVWNKTSQRMKSPSRANPTSEWVRSGGAFDAVLPQKLFDEAQLIMRQRAEAVERKYSAAGMLDDLRGLFARYGTVSRQLVAGSEGLASPATYSCRFDGVEMAYQALFRDAIEAKRLQVVEALKAAAVEVEAVDDFLVIGDHFSVAIQPSVPIARGYEAFWVFRPDQRVEVDITVGVPLSCPDEMSVLGYLAFPRLLFPRKVRIHSGDCERVVLHACALVELINSLRQ